MNLVFFIVVLATVIIFFRKISEKIKKYNETHLGEKTLNKIRNSIEGVDEVLERIRIIESHIAELVNHVTKSENEKPDHARDDESSKV